MDVFSARATAWRSEMRRGQKMAGATRFPGEGNEVFTATVSSWQAGMQSGQLTRPSAPDDHGRTTPSCGGCAIEQPCGDCGDGNKSESPEHQALRWGMLQASAAFGSGDLFSATAIVSQALHDAPLRNQSAGWLAIEEMVRSAQLGEYAAMAIGQQPAVLYDSTIGGAGHILRVPLFHFEWFKNRPRCGAYLDYSVSDAESKKENEVSVKMTGVASFRSDWPYRCECCEFRQRVMSVSVTFSSCADPKHDGPVPLPPMKDVEDCTWTVEYTDQVKDPITGVVTSERKTTNIGGGADRPPPMPEQLAGRDPEFIAGPECYGHREDIPSGLPPKTPDGPPRPPYPGGKGYRALAGESGLCLYVLDDSPTITVPRNCRFKWNLHLKGMVQPAAGCRGTTISEEIEVEVTGINAGGKIYETKIEVLKPGGQVRNY